MRRIERSTVLLKQSEYKDLVKAQVKLEILERYLDQTTYVSKEDVRAIIDAEEKEA